MKNEKKAYSTPALTVHGDVETVTQANKLGARFDGILVTQLLEGGGTTLIGLLSGPQISDIPPIV